VRENDIVIIRAEVGKTWEEVVGLLESNVPSFVCKQVLLRKRT
jgi:hypothetical protein